MHYNKLRKYVFDLIKEKSGRTIVILINNFNVSILNFIAFGLYKINEIEIYFSLPNSLALSLSLIFSTMDNVKDLNEHIKHEHFS